MRRGIVPWVSRVQRGWFDDILKAQIEHYNPDILLNQTMDNISSSFLKEIKPHGRLLMGQHAAPLPEGEDFSCYNLVVSSLPNLVKHFRRIGVPAEPQAVFEPQTLQTRDGEPKAIAFVGSITVFHDEESGCWISLQIPKYNIRARVEYCQSIIDSTALPRRLGALTCISFYSIRKTTSIITLVWQSLILTTAGCLRLRVLGFARHRPRKICKMFEPTRKSLFIQP
jgi:hypothetical protein